MKLKQILVVDDSKLNQVILSEILKDEYEVVCVSSGKEMFEKLEETDPKLILLDIIMPGLDGFEVIEKLKSSDDYNKIPVIFITGLDDAATEEKGFSLGAIDYITKPFKDKVIKARIRSYITLYEFIRQTEILGQNDGLTGLYNKNMTEKVIKKHLDENSSLKSGALMIIDVDNFKSINDNFGHLYGDAVLKHLGTALREIFQKSDVLGRVGGDEFFVFLRNYGDQSVLEMKAAEVCENFARSYEQNGQVINISASVGIATTSDSKDFETIYKYADIALYNTKAAGKNGFNLYTGNESLVYKSERTSIESEATSEDPMDSISIFKENLKEYVFNLVEETKVAEQSIQSILNMISSHFNFDSASISKFDYQEGYIKHIKRWMSGDPTSVSETEDLPLVRFTDIYNLFFKENLLVSTDIDNFDILGTSGPDGSISYAFSLKNKKILLGHITFVKNNCDCELNPKMKKSLIDVCQQLSTVVTNQFLIENSIRQKDNLAAVLDNIEEPVYVATKDNFKPLFMNKAAREADIKMHGRSCFKSGDGECHSCPLKKAMAVGGSYEDDEVYCKEILWSGSFKAYIIRHKKQI